MSRKTVKLVQPDGSVRTYDATGHDIHIDQPLSEILINYRPAGSIVDKVFPIVPVGKQSNVYYQFTQADLWRIPDTTRSQLTAAKMVDFNVSSDTYYAKNYALATGVSIEDAVNADEVLRLRETKALFIADLLTLDWENRVAALVTNSSNVGTVTTVASGAWGAFETAGPLVDIDVAIRSVRGATGYTPNRMVMGWDAWNAMKYNKFIRQMLFPAAGGAAGAGIPNTQQVANLFNFDEVLVGGTMRNTAAEGLSISLADIWGPHCLVYYAPPRPSRETPSYGYTFRWTAPGIANMTVEDLGFDRRLKGNILDIGFYQDEKLTGTNLGTWISSVM